MFVIFIRNQPYIMCNATLIPFIICFATFMPVYVI